MRSVNDEWLACLPKQTGRDEEPRGLLVTCDYRAQMLEIETVPSECISNDLTLLFDYGRIFGRTGKHPFKHHAAVCAENLTVQSFYSRQIFLRHRARGIGSYHQALTRNQRLHPAQAVFFNEIELAI